eukprot:gene155-biopygen8996
MDPLLQRLGDAAVCAKAQRNLANPDSSRKHADFTTSVISASATPLVTLVGECARSPRHSSHAASSQHACRQSSSDVTFGALSSPGHFTSSRASGKAEVGQTGLRGSRARARRRDPPEASAPWTAQKPRALQREGPESIPNSS